MTDEHGDLSKRLARFYRLAERRHPGTIRAVQRALREEQLDDVDDTHAPVDPAQALAEAERLLAEEARTGGWSP